MVCQKDDVVGGRAGPGRSVVVVQMVQTAMCNDSVDTTGVVFVVVVILTVPKKKKKKSRPWVLLKIRV